MAEVSISEDLRSAIKTVPLFIADDDGGGKWATHLQGEAINEAVTFRRLNDCKCPHIVHLYGIDVDSDRGTIAFRERVMEQLPPVIGDQTLVKKYIKDMFEGLYGMHKAGVLHRDIKLDNLMVDIYSGDLRFIDFGLSALDSSATSGEYQEFYTLFFRPPEVMLQARDYDVEKAEVWAAGVCAASMILGIPMLFKGKSWHRVLSCIVGAFGYFSSSWETLPMWYDFYNQWDGPMWEGGLLLDRITDPLAKDFVARCLALNPSKRGTVLELLHHPYIDGAEMGESPPITNIIEHQVDSVMSSVFCSSSVPAMWLYMTEKVLQDIEFRSYPMMTAAAAIVGIVNDRYLSLGTTSLRGMVGRHTACELVTRLLKTPATLDVLSKRYHIMPCHVTPVHNSNPLLLEIDSPPRPAF